MTDQVGPAGDSPVVARGRLGALVRSRWGGPIVLATALGAWLGTQVALSFVLALVFIARAGGKVDPVALEAFVMDRSAMLIFASTLAIIAVTLVLRALDALPEPPPLASSRRTAAFVVGGAVLCFGGQQAITWLQLRAGLQWSEQELVTRNLAGHGWLLFALAILIGAPVGEELVFRCLGYGALRPWTRPVAALLTAFLFALVHLNATATLLYVWIALCCTVVYEKTGRFAAPMIVQPRTTAWRSPSASDPASEDDVQPRSSWTVVVERAAGSGRPYARVWSPCARSWSGLPRRAAPWGQA